MPEVWTEPRIYGYLAVAACLGCVLWLLLWLRYGIRRATFAATLVTLFSAISGLLYIVSLSSVTETQTNGQRWPGVIAVAGLEGLFALVVPYCCSTLSFCAAGVIALFILEVRHSRGKGSATGNGGHHLPGHDTTEHGV